MINRVIRLGIFGLVVAGSMACDNDDEQKGFRKSMSYNSLDTAVAYSAQFLDESGQPRWIWLKEITCTKCSRG
jgi:hypothetical protein